MNNKREQYSSGTKWEEMAGYSRAVRQGDRIFVSGTTATDKQGALVGAGDPAAQARYVIHKIEQALQALDASLSDVIRTRVYVSKIEDWQAVAQVHGEFFSDIRPANTLVEAKLVGPEFLVEIEAEAIV